MLMCACFASKHHGLFLFGLFLFKHTLVLILSIVLMVFALTSFAFCAHCVSQLHLVHEYAIIAIRKYSICCKFLCSWKF